MNVAARKHSYDQACETLAEHFLAGNSPTEADVQDLAQTIQSAVEDWFHNHNAALDEAADDAEATS